MDLFFKTGDELVLIEVDGTISGTEGARKVEKMMKLLTDEKGKVPLTLAGVVLHLAICSTIARRSHEPR